MLSIKNKWVYEVFDTTRKVLACKETAKKFLSSPLFIKNLNNFNRFIFFMKNLFLLMFFSLSGCSSNSNLSLASKYGEIRQNFDSLKEELRKIYSSCNYNEDCFLNESEDYFDTICSNESYLKYGYIDINECQRTSMELVHKIISLNNSPGQPVVTDAEVDQIFEDLKENIERETETQKQHYERMYELEQQRNYREQEEANKQAQERQAEIERQILEEQQRNNCLNKIKRDIDRKQSNIVNWKHKNIAYYYSDRCALYRLQNKRECPQTIQYNSWIKQAEKDIESLKKERNNC